MIETLRQALRRAGGVMLLAAGSACAAAGSPAGALSLPAVVVWDFDNQTAPALSALPPAQLDWLRRSLSESLIASLLQVPGLPVVERLRLHDLLAEQKLGASALADDESRIRLGRIVGAARMVFGGFFAVGDEVQVHLRLVDTATARVLLSDEFSAPFAEVMQHTQPIVERLAHALGGELSAGAAYPAAWWQDYDRALALADAGRLDEAEQSLRGLLARAPGFVPAQRQLVAVLDRIARR